MSEVINRMLVMHTKMSINCNQNQPCKQMKVTDSRCTETGANGTGGPRAGEILVQASQPIRSRIRHSVE